jgi:hypothetical protein
MSYTLTFTQTSPTTASLEVSYDLGDTCETGSEFFTYYAAKPENVIRETRVLTTKAGRRIQFGTMLNERGLGLGVAWPLDEAPAQEYCPNCQSHHAPESLYVHSGQCQLCASDGHTTCQHEEPAHDTYAADAKRWADRLATHAARHPGHQVKRDSTMGGHSYCRDCQRYVTLG